MAALLEGVDARVVGGRGLKVTISTSNSGVTITDGTAVATPPKPS